MIINSSIVFSLFIIFLSYIIFHQEFINVLSVPSMFTNSSWVSGTNMPTPRTELTGTVLDEKIYGIGGLGFSEKPTNTVEVYDPDKHKWSTAASLPEPLDHPAAASYKDKLYVIGGYKEFGTPSDKLFIYDPVIDEWKEGEPMPTARGALTANFIDGILYAVGGKNKHIKDHNGESLQTLQINEAYDPVSNTWTEKEPMPTARHHLTSAVVDGKLYVIGGRQTNEKPHVVVDTVEMYDPITNTWTEKEPMPTKRSAMTAVAVIDDIYVLGGAIEECPPSKGAQPNRVFNNNEKYNTVSNTWKAEPPMPTARHGPLSVLIDGDKIYAIGGGPQPCFSLSNMTEIFLLAN